MGHSSADPWRARAVADAAVERTAQELRELVQALAQALNPFPGFQGMATLQAVEVPSAASADPNRGCVVVGPDGELYELVLRLIAAPPEMGGMDQVEELRALDLPLHEYIPYAHSAIQELARIHQERGKRHP